MNDLHSVLPPITFSKLQQFPVIYRQHIYFPSSSLNRTLFIENPRKYMSQASPGPGVPITLAVVGPPKSGKTTSMWCVHQEIGTYCTLCTFSCQ